jgi:hypothetical protein
MRIVSFYHTASSTRSRRTAARRELTGRSSAAASWSSALLIHGGNSVAIGRLPLLARLHSRFHLFAGCGLTTMFNDEACGTRCSKEVKKTLSAAPTS